MSFLDWLLSDSSTLPSPIRGEEIALFRASRRAMATDFEIVLPAAEPRALEIANECLDLVDDIESQLTVYRDDSEVALLNRDGSRKAMPVSNELFELLERAAMLTRATEGGFDIATGALTKAWGFYRREGRMPTPPQRAEAMAQTGMRHVVLNAESRTVRFLRPGLELNFGAIGKGYALDRASHLLRDQSVRSAFIHGGGSSVLALDGPDSSAPGWSVSIRHPHRPEEKLGTVWLRDEALGTSADTHQFFEYNGKKLGHVLDPRRGWPAEGASQVSVLAASAADADALSTAFFVMGLARTREFCRTHPEIRVIFLESDEAEPIAINMPREKWMPASPT